MLCLGMFNFSGDVELSLQYSLDGIIKYSSSIHIRNCIKKVADETVQRPWVLLTCFIALFKYILRKR